MFGLKLPALAAAGAVAVLAVGGVPGLPKQAVADEGGGGPGGSSSSSSSSSASSSSSSGGMDVSPRTVAPGGVVSLHLATSCKAGKKAKASADVFVDTVTLAPSGDGHGMEGDAFIKSDALAGSYSVSVECDGGSASAAASITVSAVSGTVPLTPADPGRPLQPLRPVPAGGGGAAKELAGRGGAQQLAAGPAAAGASTGPLLVTGGVAAAGLAGLALYRRRTAARG